MRDEDTGLAGGLDAGRDKARREGHQGGEKVAIRHAESERIRCAVGESADGDFARVGAAQSECLGKSLIDELHIGTVAGADGVPGAFAGGGREEHEAELIGQSAEAADALLLAAGGAVEVEEKGSGVGRGRRHVEKRIAFRAQVQGSQAGLEIAAGVFSGPGVQARGGLGAAARGQKRCEKDSSRRHARLLDARAEQRRACRMGNL
jgi:hypothetical protein